MKSDLLDEVMLDVPHFFSQLSDWTVFKHFPLCLGCESCWGTTPCTWQIQWVLLRASKGATYNGKLYYYLELQLFFSSVFICDIIRLSKRCYCLWVKEISMDILLVYYVFLTPLSLSLNQKFRCLQFLGVTLSFWYCRLKCYTNFFFKGLDTICVYFLFLAKIISYYFSFFWLSENQFHNSYKTSYHCNTWRNINGLSWIHSYWLSSVTVKHGLDCWVVEGCWLSIMSSLSFSLCYMSFICISEALIMLKERRQPSALKAPSMCREALYYVRVGKFFFCVMQVMQKHQKYFAMTDENGLLLPYFVTVSCFCGKLLPA